MFFWMIYKPTTPFHYACQNYGRDEMMEFVDDSIDISDPVHKLILMKHFPLTTDVLKFKYGNDQKFEKMRRLFYPSYLI